MKTAIYCRVSTSDQTTLNQELELKSYCDKNGYDIFKVYKDDGVSGVKTSRPELDKMLQDMRNKEFEAVIVYKFDRLGRSTIHLLQVLEEMKKRKIRLIATSQNIDTSTEMGTFFYTVLSGVAQLERGMIVERIGLGLKRAKKEGKKLGRPVGAKDRGRRKKSGYLLRWQSEKVLI